MPRTKNRKQGLLALLPMAFISLLLSHLPCPFSPFCPRRTACTPSSSSPGPSSFEQILPSSSLSPTRGSPTAVAALLTLLSLPPLDSCGVNGGETCNLRSCSYNSPLRRLWAMKSRMFSFYRNLLNKASPTRRSIWVKTTVRCKKKNSHVKLAGSGSSSSSP